MFQFLAFVRVGPSRRFDSARRLSLCAVVLTAAVLTAAVLTATLFAACENPWMKEATSSLYKDKDGAGN
ncbi:MAG: hypothetical protein LBK74_06015 [Treponema sp.]|nr:hypothetical protein [Treponema sp.]